jgi:hypothetical protein
MVSNKPNDFNKWMAKNQDYIKSNSGRISRIKMYQGIEYHIGGQYLVFYVYYYSSVGTYSPSNYYCIKEDSIKFCVGKKYNNDKDLIDFIGSKLELYDLFSSMLTMFSKLYPIVLDIKQGDHYIKYLEENELSPF